MHPVSDLSPSVSTSRASTLLTGLWPGLAESLESVTRADLDGSGSSAQTKASDSLLQLEKRAKVRLGGVASGASVGLPDRIVCGEAHE